MARIVAIGSAKGGVGKTTVCANLATALAEYNKSVVAIDGNLTTSNLGLHLGIPLYPVTLQDVINNTAKLKDAIYYHYSGFKIIPSDISMSKLMTPGAHDFLEVFYKLTKGVDFILIDSAAGLGQEALSAVEAADELITVTNPEMPALTDALKLTRFAENYGTMNLGAIVNRVKGERHEQKISEIESFLNIPVLGRVREDRNVKRAIAKKQPVVAYRPSTRASRDIKKIARVLLGIEETIKETDFGGFFSWLRR